MQVRLGEQEEGGEVMCRRGRRWVWWVGREGGGGGG